jgi:alkanesulfonate monooxygenase SsuD/methylene tetrahydromethanopterin reductase-like flavin-dependent oxidoreductase (luciferase family)
MFDEALEVMPMHWSGERFSYQGKHFNARDVIARPSPRSGSIPIWIGGNSKLTRRRVATRAQGWMPMSGPPEMATTTRTAHLSGLDDIGAAIRDVKEMAGDRADQLDFLVLYTDDSMLDTKKDVDRHREALARIAEAGATWVSFAWDFSTQSETLDFVEGFAANHLGGNRI